MRLAICTDTFLPQVNGVTNTLGKMRDYMKQQGIEYKFLVPEDQGMQYAPQEVMSFYSINFFLYPECKVAIPRYALVKEALDNFQPDLIHLVTPFPVGLAGLKYAREYNIPIVSSYHTNFPQYLEYYRVPFLEKPLWHFLRWFHSYSQVNFCPSRETMAELKKNGIENLELWGRGIDAINYNPSFYSQELRCQYQQDNEPLLLYVGRVAAEKDLITLMEAIKILNSKNYSFKLLVVGEGPEREELEAQQLPNVIFLGYKFGLELQQLYASADIFAFPSSSETYGNVILEAMASGLPVVGAYGGGVKENLKDGYNGVAFLPRDSIEMAKGLARLIDDEGYRQSLGANARAHALTRDWQQVFDSLFSNFDNVVRNQQRKVMPNLSA